MTDAPPSSFQWSDKSPARLAHSAVKHDLIRAYIRDYLEIITSVPKRRSLRMTFFDGFAGGGSFSEGDVEVSGTPVILAEEIIASHSKRSIDRNMAFDIDLWAVEKNKANYAALRSTIESRNLESVFPGRIITRHSTFEKPLREAIQSLRNQRGGTGRSVFLFDQTGYAQVNLEYIRAIFQHLPTAEVILTFSVSWLVDLARIDPAFFKNVARLGIGESDLANLMSAKDHWAPRYGGQRWVREHIERYIGAPYNTSFFLRSKDSHKDIWLLHFAQQPRARDAMMGVHYRFANQAHFYGKEGFEMLGFDPVVNSDQARLFGFTSEDADRSRSALLSDIPRALTDRGGASGIKLGNLFNRELNDATVTFDMFKKGLVEARDNGLVEILTDQGKYRNRAKNLDRNDIVKTPDQVSLWHFLN